MTGTESTAAMSWHVVKLGINKFLNHGCCCDYNYDYIALQKKKKMIVVICCNFVLRLRNKSQQ